MQGIESGPGYKGGLMVEKVSLVRAAAAAAFLMVDLAELYLAANSLCFPKVLLSLIKDFLLALVTVLIEMPSLSQVQR